MRSSRYRAAGWVTSWARARCSLESSCAGWPSPRSPALRGTAEAWRSSAFSSVQGKPARSPTYRAPRVNGPLLGNAVWPKHCYGCPPAGVAPLHLSGLSLGLASGGPVFFGGISCLLGGFLTDRQVRLWGRRWGRTLLGVVSYGVAGALLLLTILATAKHVALAYVALCLSSFIKDFGLASSWATTIDVGHRYSGTVAGVMNSLGNLSQVVSPPIVAWMVVGADAASHPSWKATLYYYAAMC